MGGGWGAPHLILDVGEAGGEVDGEDDEDDVAFGVAERAQAVVLLLPGRVPQGELDDLAIVHHLRHVVLKHCRFAKGGILLQSNGVRRQRLDILH